MFDKLKPFVIKINCMIKFIPKNYAKKNITKTKNISRTKNKNNLSSYIECDDKYLRKIIENGGL